MWFEGLQLLVEGLLVSLPWEEGGRSIGKSEQTVQAEL